MPDTARYQHWQGSVSLASGNGARAGVWDIGGRCVQGIAALQQPALICSALFMSFLLRRPGQSSTYKHVHVHDTVEGQRL